MCERETECLEADLRLGFVEIGGVATEEDCVI